ncbi:MAG: epoxyqueuosine reductase QueH, partial [Planctomycetota bacterium]
MQAGGGGARRGAGDALLKRLLHVCCANCLSDVAGALGGEDVELVLLFANPNIHP